MEESNVKIEEEVKEQLAETVDEVISENPKVIQEEISSSTEKAGFFKKIFSKNNLKKTIPVLAAIIVVISAAIGYLVYSSPKSIAVRFYKAVYKEDFLTEASLLAYDYKEYFIKMLNYKDEEELFEKYGEWQKEDINSWSDYNKVRIAVAKENYEDKLGEYTTSIKATRDKDISVKKLKSELSKQLDNIEKYTDFDRESITDAKIVSIKVKLDGEDDDIRESIDVYLAKIDGGAWKVIGSIFED